MKGGVDAHRLSPASDAQQGEDLNMAKKKKKGKKGKKKK
jgi:hypothetical protein